MLGNPWVESAAGWTEQKACAAYDYCDNQVQKFLEGKDVDRIVAGGKTFLKGVAEAFGGSALIVVGGVEVSTGAGAPLGAAKITLGVAGWITAIADVSQGTQDIEFGWNGDSTTPNSNFIRDTLFGGDEKKYGVVSTLIGAVGVYTGFVYYPMLASTSATALIPGRGTQGNAGGQIRSSDDVVRGNSIATRGTLTGKLDGLTKDERAMINDLLNSGKNVEIIPRSDTSPTPDFLVDGVKTELKTLNGSSLNTPVTRIEDGFNQGAEAVLIDARKTNLTLDQANHVIIRALGKYNGELPGIVEIWTSEGIIRR